jgi:hypothetical protein
MDLVAVFTIIGVAIANIGTTITLFLWSTGHTEKARDQTTAILNAISQEMKDFHARLCVIESNRGK